MAKRTRDKDVDTTYSHVERLIWRDHRKGPGVATFEYDDGGHDHQKMSFYEARTLAESVGLTELADKVESKEWIKLQAKPTN